MRGGALILACGILAASPGSALAAKDTGVRVWLLLPDRVTEEAEVAVEQTHRALLTVLADPVVRERVVQRDGKTALLYQAGSWQIAVKREKREALIAALRESWRERMRIEDPPREEEHAWPWPAASDAGPDAPAPDSVDFAGVAESVKNRIPVLLAAREQDRFYDNANGAKGSGDAVLGKERAPGETILEPSPESGPKGRYHDIIEEEAAKAGVSPAVVRALIAAKSGFDAKARGGGAYGLMLVSPAAAESVGVRGDKLEDPRMNVRAGALVLAGFMKRFNGDLRRSLAAYQAGAGAARKDSVFARKDVKAFLEDFGENYKTPKAKPAPKAPRVEPPAPGRASSRTGTPFEDAIQREAKEAGIDPDIVRAVIAAKSGFNPKRQGGGAYGLMMVSHGVAASEGLDGGDILDPDANIRVGTRHLAGLLKRFDGDVHRALAAYQAGGEAVRRSGGIPNRGDVRNFLAAYEKAYRQNSPAPAPVEPVEPPKHPTLREWKDAAKSVIYHDPKDPVSKYRAMIEKASEKHGVDPRLIEAMMRRENPWGNPKLVSSAGAVGLMQLMPKTARLLGVKNSNDPAQNIDGGIRHFKELLIRFNGDRVRAVAAYNSGHVPVERLGRVPNYRETVVYVAEVFNNYYDLTGEKVDYRGHLSTKAQLWAKRVEDQRERNRSWD